MERREISLSSLFSCFFSISILSLVCIIICKHYFPHLYLLISTTYLLHSRYISCSICPEIGLSLNDIYLFNFEFSWGFGRGQLCSKRDWEHDLWYKSEYCWEWKAELFIRSVNQEQPRKIGYLCKQLLDRSEV